MKPRIVPTSRRQCTCGRSTVVNKTSLLLSIYLLILSNATLAYSFTPINRSLHVQTNQQDHRSTKNHSPHYRNKSNGCSHQKMTILKAIVTDPEIISLQPEIKVEESRIEHKLGDSATVILAARIAHDDGTCECEGYLVQISDSNDFEAQILCPHASIKSMDHFTAVFHKLLLQYLTIEDEIYEEERGENRKDDYGDDDDRITSYAYSSAKLSISLDGIPDELSEQLIGILPAQSEPSNGGLGIKLANFVPFLNEYTFRHRGTEQGNTSLEILKMLSARRVPFNFSAHETESDDSEGEMKTTGATTTSKIETKASIGRNVISLQRQILSPYVVEKIMDIMEEIKSRQWLSTNPDSVDGLPSLHLNLITNGNPLFDKSSIDEEITFPKCISQMTDILRPHLDDNLLPAVRKMTNSPTVEISDVFIRNYGKMKLGDDDSDSSKTRYGLSPHYDVTAYATCVMALDSTAANGKNGLYTVSPDNGMSSSNAALRRFFSLDKGDGVVHTYDILHGVDVDPKLNRPRTSLVVWFVDRGGDNNENLDDVNQPWLLNPIDDIGEFVLGLASESSEEEDGSHLKLKNAIDPLDLYLSSASRGNIYAMTTLGQLCDDDLVPDSHYERVRDILLSHDFVNPFILSGHKDSGVAVSMSGGNRCRTLANGLWYHASIVGGNRVAQVSLADELMLQYMMDKDVLTPTEQENMSLMASTLFTMALNQGYDSIDSLRRLMDVECRRLQVLGLEIPSEEFFCQPVVQVLMMSV